ncbi:hypothetical protein N7481_013099 [Penicillium waksmanii]|uniref:uncharacterized protein n=1 Tax=Penicillium waksmanii TaxID=69791 RepID=UPI0025481757|nr:uncharacterized protein N7481_013099 [Penicillium waksmanii]KAJ5966385.1 hypothetical protein N7481_013099 [Penicillium waksmanii]
MAQNKASTDDDTVPGTEIMCDWEEPSNDPNDPLNWSKTWKYIIITTQFLFLFVAVESALSMGPMFPLFAAEFNLNDTQLSLLSGACVLALGYSNFIIVPFSNIFGRRLTSLIFCALGIGSCIWQALATSHSSLLGARVVNGVATATSETILVQVIADMLFLHERGLWTGVYFTGYFMGLFIGPVIAGNIAERFGWRSFFWLSLAMSCFNFLTLLIFFPETKFHRRNIDETRSLELDSTQPSITLDKDRTGHLENLEPALVTVGTGRPSKSQFRLWQGLEKHWKQFIVRDIISPFKFFFFPIIFWAGLNVAGPANLLLYWNLTESAFFSAPPYNFTPAGVGYTNFAFAIGGLVGLATAGPFSDWVAMKATRRNNGIREAEMRLPALIPYFITTVIGIVIGGLGYQNLWEWPIILVVGFGLSGLCVTAVPTIVIAYAVDCYKPISGEIMVVATVIKNTCGFVMSYWVSTLAEKKGFITPTMVEFSLTIGPMLLGIPIYFFGKKLRKLSQNSFMNPEGE